MTNEEKLSLAMRQVSGPCVRCGAPTDNVAAFIPNNPEAWGAPRGKVRFFAYALCRPCMDQSTPEERETWVWATHAFADRAET